VAERVSILGSTGSVGRNVLDVVRRFPNRFQVAGLVARRNVDLLRDQVLEFHPGFVAVADPSAAERFRAMRLPVELRVGAEGVESLAAEKVDVVVCALVGAAGLQPLLSAIDAGNRVALANKEALVMAGGTVTRRARERGITILPVDSEHSAIFQCLRGSNVRDVRCVHLTASGGPFHDRPRDTLRNVTPDQATSHPRWSMGTKISVDSATLMNKGLEVIEAMWLFGLPLSKIKVVIHPQSIVHGLVEFNDGGILAHLAVTDMRLPILFALGWPERVESSMGRLDLTAIRELTFSAPDFAEFPCLRLALAAAEWGGAAPAVLNAANEAAVDAFCGRRIGFLQISEVVEQVLQAGGLAAEDDLDTILAADKDARRRAESVIKTLGGEV